MILMIGVGAVFGAAAVIFRAATRWQPLEGLEEAMALGCADLAREMGARK